MTCSFSSDFGQFGVILVRVGAALVTNPVKLLWINLFDGANCPFAMEFLFDSFDSSFNLPTSDVDVPFSRPLVTLTLKENNYTVESEDR